MDDYNNTSKMGKIISVTQPLYTFYEILCGWYLTGRYILTAVHTYKGKVILEIRLDPESLNLQAILSLMLM